MATTSEIRIEHAHDGDHQQEDWSGGKRPFGASYGKLMMWYFLLSDAFTFAGFLIAYGTLRFSMPTWPVPDFVFQTLPFGITGAPLIFVTIMTFVLIISSVTMVRAVQEGHRENQRGVMLWMALTVVGGAAFLGCQAWEWTNLIGTENMTVLQNPFGTHVRPGVYIDENGDPLDSDKARFEAGDSYLVHALGHGGGHGEDHEGAEHEGAVPHKATMSAIVAKEDEALLKRVTTDLEEQDLEVFVSEWDPALYRVYVDENGDGEISEDETELSTEIYHESLGPTAFGALFFFITGFHGFHVFSGVLFLLIILINVTSGIYIKRKNSYEMVEKIGLYWHFVDLVWVFVFLVFYLL